MSKAISGHFNKTLGQIILNSNLKDIHNTAEVWQHLKSTQPNYTGTDLPRSFTIDTLMGKMWTHGNATKHMHEAISSLKQNPLLKFSNPHLYTQFILYDYWKSLNNAVRNGITYDKIINKEHWEFIFAKPRKKGEFPIIKHAKYNGKM